MRALLNPAAREHILAMAIPNGTWNGGQLDWNGIPLTPSVWPNEGLGYGTVRASVRVSCHVVCE